VTIPSLNETSEGLPGVEETTAASASASPPVTDGNGTVVRLDELEKQAIKAALRQTAGNRTQAATALGISIRTLRNKLQEYRESGDAVDADLDPVDA
jgi:DNA-binding NtrC family response regulator